MTDEAKALVERLQEIAQFIEAAKRHVYGLPVAAIRSDTHDNKMALWCDNGMAGVGQVCVSVNVGEFPDQQLSAIAGLTNAAMSALKCLYASADLIETQAREIERLRTAGDQMLTAFAEGTNWTAEKRAAYEAMNAALAGDSHDQ